jgi:hypothetical protein
MRQMSHKKKYGILLDILPVMTSKRIVRFKSKISTQPTDQGCLLWLPRTRNSQGYGLFQGSTNYQGFSFLSHRIVWAIEHNEEPGERIVRHTCDNPPCCNGQHLLIGYSIDNHQDSVDRGRYHNIGNYSRGRLGPNANAADYTEEQRLQAITLRYQHRYTMQQVVEVIGCHRSTLYLWFKEYEASILYNTQKSCKMLVSHTNRWPDK